MSNGYVQRLQKKLEELAHERDATYLERNRLVCFLSKIFPSYRGLHETTNSKWDKQWMNIIYIETPKGQLSWHIHQSLLPMFEHLELRGTMLGPNWDGHTTEEKYQRLASLTKNDLIEMFEFEI